MKIIDYLCRIFRIKTDKEKLKEGKVALLQAGDYLPCKYCSDEAQCYKVIKTSSKSIDLELVDIMGVLVRINKNKIMMIFNHLIIDQKYLTTIDNDYVK